MAAVAVVPVTTMMVLAGPAWAAGGKPGTHITGSGSAVKYMPATLSVKWSGPTEQTCTAAKASFTITNSTKASETVTYSGKTFANVPAGKTLDVCAWGHGTASAVFGLAANSKAKLTVHVS